MRRTHATITAKPEQINDEYSNCSGSDSQIESPNRPSTRFRLDAIYSHITSTVPWLRIGQSGQVYMGWFELLGEQQWDEMATRVFPFIGDFKALFPGFRAIEYIDKF